MESRLLLEKFPPQTGLEPGTARSAGQRLTYGAVAASVMQRLSSCRSTIKVL